jgi:RNA polymerase sigma factor (sigma-70 family)
MSDMELIRQYVEQDSEEAFAALVGRHVNLVFSSARRQVGSEEMARDVAQVVFLDLSNNAGRLRPGTHLASWLHVVTRRTAVDAIRRESRRQSRERIAVEIAAMKSTSPTWTNIEPLLDEAIEALDPGDRTAVLLRYFEGRSLRDIGEELGISDDAAQKRVSRAVDRLRDFFSSRGVAASAAGIAAEISANAVQAAPAGVGAAISSAVALSAGAAHKAAVAQLARNLTMTTTQKTIVVATLAAAIGGGLYQGHVIQGQSARIAAFERQSATADEQMRSLRSERDAALARSAAIDRPGDKAASSLGGTGAAVGVDPTARLKILEDLQKRKILNSRMTFIDPTGGLSSSFIELFSLTGEEQAALQKAVDEGRRQIGSLMVANATVHSNADNNIVIDVKPLEGGPAVGDGVMNAIAGILGPDRNSSFVALGANQLEESLGSFGAEQETLSITDNTASTTPNMAEGYVVDDRRILPGNQTIENITNYPNLDAVLARWPVAPLIPKKF